MKLKIIILYLLIKVLSKYYDKCFKEQKLDKPKGVPYEYKWNNWKI